MDADAAAEIFAAHDMERMSRAAAGLPRGASPLDHSESAAYKFWYGPEGALEDARRAEKMLALRRRVLRIGQPLALTLCAAAGWTLAPAPARLASRWLPYLHGLIPLLLIALEARRFDCALAEAKATHVVCAGSALAALAHPLSYVLARASAPIEAWLLIFLAQPAMILPLWWWRDLNMELCDRSTRSRVATVTRGWRLAASAACIVRMASAARVLAGCFRLNAQLRPGWQTPCIRALAGRVGAAAASLPRYSPTVAGAAGVAGAATATATALYVGRAAATAYVIYALWCLAFPLEALTRTSWRSSLLPDRRPVRTITTSLLERFAICRPSPTERELAEMAGIRSAAVEGRGEGGVPSMFARLSPDQVRDDRIMRLGDAS